MGASERDALPAYNFKREATIVCEAIGSTCGNMTVQCALREAFAAGREQGRQDSEARLREAIHKWRDGHDAEEVLWCAEAELWLAEHFGTSTPATGREGAGR